MKFERWFGIAVILLLLVGGLFLGRSLDPNHLSNPVTPDAESGVFRDWLWERRALDLMAQVALIFAGTLGVAAILPNSAEMPRVSSSRSEE